MLYIFSLFFCLQRSRLSRDRRGNKTPKNTANSLNPFNLNTSYHFIRQQRMACSSNRNGFLTLILAFS
jgi:hypothetical protein